jgi:hypothetical protein
MRIVTELPEITLKLCPIDNSQDFSQRHANERLYFNMYFLEIYR